MKRKITLWICIAYGGREMMRVDLETKKKREVDSSIVQKLYLMGRDSGQPIFWL